MFIGRFGVNSYDIFDLDKIMKPISDKDFAFTMGKLLKQKKFGLYKMAVEKRKKWFLENKLSGQRDLPLDK